MGRYFIGSDRTGTGVAEESDLERTEQPSARRLEKAREEGDVPRSRELATCTILLAAGAGLWGLSHSIAQSMQHFLVSQLQFERAVAFDFNVMTGKLAVDVMDVMLTFAPLAALLMVVALGSPLLIGGWLFTPSLLLPNFTRMNPLNGFGNMISLRALVELLKAIGKACIIGVLSWIVIKGQFSTMLALPVEPLQKGIRHLGSMMLDSYIVIILGLVLIALIDVPYQLWNYTRRLKMTRQELRQEAKESDGNPEVKAKIRAQQREMARRRMMAKVPTADVVVTNPTHYAVALKYDDGAMRAPRVVAKGADVIAARIRELAREHDVPMLEAPPLARALYRYTDLEQEIPQALYTAVAEVLAYVYQLRTAQKLGESLPPAPTALAVPPELDPQSGAGVNDGDDE